MHEEVVPAGGAWGEFASGGTLFIMGETVEIVPYDAAWSAMFATWGTGLRAALGDTALRIDHIGSTSVPGLAAKPVIDIQISVASLDPPDAFLGPLTDMGLVYRADNPERTKRYFREPPGQRRTHVHVRQLGSFSQQFPLLFRDYLRCQASVAEGYAAAKRRCAAKYRNDRPAYVQAKDAVVWDIIRRADAWAQRTGWVPGPGDA
ncbi:GrpB family protein [Streptomyces sp. NPDC053427]|uniref:GrpB family protein n=1 Tax=Streptomyces sp. NPDC053427 TaxID=3365701 RepID=UPI0037D75A30